MPPQKPPERRPHTWCECPARGRHSRRLCCKCERWVWSGCDAHQWAVRGEGRSPTGAGKQGAERLVGPRLVLCLHRQMFGWEGLTGGRASEPRRWQMELSVQAAGNKVNTPPATGRTVLLSLPPPHSRVLTPAVSPGHPHPHFPGEEREKRGSHDPGNHGYLTPQPHPGPSAPGSLRGSPSWVQSSGRGGLRPCKAVCGQSGHAAQPEGRLAGLSSSGNAPNHPQPSPHPALRLSVNGKGRVSQARAAEETAQAPSPSPSLQPHRGPPTPAPLQPRLPRPPAYWAGAPVSEAFPWGRQVRSAL